MAEKQYLKLSNFEKLSKIGQGGFGKVFKVRDKATGEIYAAKVSNNNNNKADSDELIYLKREVDIMSKLNHPAIVKFIGFSPEDFNNLPNPVIITQFLPNSSLSEILDLERNGITPDGFDKTKKLICIYGIASGMSYLHSHKIIHRDLKPANILMDDQLFPKIADFGLSKIIHREKSNTPQSKSGVKGTINYIAPEIWESYEYTEASDVYAFSMIVYEIITDEVPYKDVPDFLIMKKISNGERPNFPDSIERCYQALIESCWSEDPSKRPTFSDIVNKLKSDEFITEDIDKDEFDDYIKYINEYIITFDEEKLIVLQNSFHQSVKLKSELKQKLFFPNEIFELLDKTNENLVNESKTNASKKFIIGKNLVEGKNGFPQNIEIGVNYLEVSMKEKCFDSLIYLCNMLIKGDVIPQDLELAKEYLSNYKNDSRIIYLKGKISNKQKNYVNSRICFQQSSKTGNCESMYKYAKMLFTGLGGCTNTKEAIYYFQISQKGGNEKSKLFLNTYNQMIKISGFTNLPNETQHLIIRQAMKNNSEFKMNINFDKLQMIYENNSIESAEFINALKLFSIFKFDIIYPFETFNPIFESLKKISSCTNIKMIGHLQIEGPENLSYNFGENDIIDTVDINYSVKMIGERVFSKFKSLIRITIPPTVKSICGYAFECCSSLKEINIPDSVKEIGITAFFGCTSLKNVSASQNIFKLFYDFGLDYKLGRNVTKNKEEAYRHFKIAADGGNVDSMFEYGKMTEASKSKGSRQKAINYYQMAADKGHKEAKKCFEDLSKPDEFKFSFFHEDKLDATDILDILNNIPAECSFLLTGSNVSRSEKTQSEETQREEAQSEETQCEEAQSEEIQREVIKYEDLQYSHSLVVGGDNKYSQLGEKSTFKTENEDVIIHPPVISSINPSSLLSFSIYNANIVLVTNDHLLKGIGFDCGRRISETLPKKVIRKFTEYTINDENGFPLTPISAVCSSTGALYMFSKDSNIGDQLVACDQYLNNGQNVLLNIGNQKIVALFAGFVYAAAITSCGEVMIVDFGLVRKSPKSLIESFSLPNGEKASSIACLQYSILVLSMNGKVFESPIDYKKKKLSDYIAFSQVDELSDHEIVCLSGTCDHCLAVNKEGTVFGRGKNSSGQLGLGEETESVSLFSKISSLFGYKIEAAYAGARHSLFQTTEGKILSCGDNRLGQLFISGNPGNRVYYPTESLITSGAKFCIAGNSISAVFVDDEPPPNTPNRRILTAKI